MKTNKIGSVNPCAMCSLLDADGKVIGHTLDTPNAIAFAMATNERCVKASAFYPLFGETITERCAVSDRFGFVVKEGAIHSRFLKWC